MTCDFMTANATLPSTPKPHSFGNNGEFLGVQSRQEVTVNLYKVPGFDVEVFLFLS